MEITPPRTLRVLLADERLENLEPVARVVTRLGHEVIGRETTITGVATAAERELPDVAIVLVGEDTEGALEQIGTIVRDAICPVIVLLNAQDPAFIRSAAKRGVFAYLVNGDVGADELESALEIVLHRFAEYHDLEGAFGRRALIERAKGILMERHDINEEAAFRMLRDHSRANSCKLVDVVQAVLGARSMLPNRPGRISDGS